MLLWRVWTPSKNAGWPWRTLENLEPTWSWFRRCIFTLEGPSNSPQDIFPTSYIASNSTGKARVTILIWHTCPIRVKSYHLDPLGRFVILSCDYLSTAFTLINIYARTLVRLLFHFGFWDTAALCPTFLRLLVVILIQFALLRGIDRLCFIQLHLVRCRLYLLLFANSSTHTAFYICGAWRIPLVNNTCSILHFIKCSLG